MKLIQLVFKSTMVHMVDCRRLSLTVSGFKRKSTSCALQGPRSSRTHGRLGMVGFRGVRAVFNWNILEMEWK